MQVMPTWTDNRGNGSALDNLMSAGFLASAIFQAHCRQGSGGRMGTEEWVTARLTSLRTVTLRWKIRVKAVNTGSEAAQESFRASVEGADTARRRKKRLVSWKNPCASQTLAERVVADSERTILYLRLHLASFKLPLMHSTIVRRLSLLVEG